MTKEEIKKELEKQLQLLSELSERKDLSPKDRVETSEEIRQICLVLLSCGLTEDQISD